jgi:DNA-binding transcriptional LysR family regulator
MSNFDWMDLDANLLRLLVAVVEEGSVTGASQRLGVTQSAVSHLLNKLREIVRDPLFVKSGRGIVATARAKALAGRASGLLLDLERFALPDYFDPADCARAFVIAANDFQRDALLPALIARLRERAPGITLRIIPSNVPTPEMLRDEHCHLVVSPRPPAGADIMQKKLFEDRYVVFFDPAMREAPATKSDYLKCDHVTVVYEPRRELDVDRWLAAREVKRRFCVTVSGFGGLAAFLRGSALIATAPSLLRFGSLHGLDFAPVPVACPKLPMYASWSKSFHNDPAHRWLRGQIDELARPLAAASSGP